MEIRRYRIAYGETQQELAEAISVDRVTVSRYENDQRSPPIEKLVLIANRYKISVDELIGRTPPKPKNIPAPDTIAAHTDVPMTPEMENRIQELIVETIKRLSQEK